uniref:Uncharacterized protein n=1 Tax=Parascaris univalens TaxID=6257 RepID=A0A915B4L9_PARUN
MVSQPLPIDQRENQPIQTSDAPLLEVETESITTSSSYEPYSTTASVSAPISFHTTYFYVTTTPYSTNSATSMWQQNLQHSTIASEAATMTIPVTEIAFIVSPSTSHTSQISSMQQSTLPLNVSLTEVPVNSAEPSAKQSFLEHITTVPIKSASTSTLISDEESSTDLGAFTHSPELQRTTAVPSEDSQRAKAVVTSSHQSIGVPTKVDNNAGSKKNNSTVVSSSRSGRTHRLPYTLRQLLQQQKRPDSPSRGSQESIDHERPSDLESSQLGTVALHPKGNMPLSKKFFPSQEIQESSGQSETFEYDAKENEIEEL